MWLSWLCYICVCVCDKPQADSEAKVIRAVCGGVCLFVLGGGGVLFCLLWFVCLFVFKQAVLDYDFRMEPLWNMGFYPFKKHWEGGPFLVPCYLLCSNSGWKITMENHANKYFPVMLVYSINKFCLRNDKRKLERKTDRLWALKNIL